MRPVAVPEPFATTNATYNDVTSLGYAASYSADQSEQSGDRRHQVHIVIQAGNRSLVSHWHAFSGPATNRTGTCADRHSQFQTGRQDYAAPPGSWAIQATLILGEDPRDSARRRTPVLPLTTGLRAASVVPAIAGTPYDSYSAIVPRVARTREQRQFHRALGGPCGVVLLPQSHPGEWVPVAALGTDEDLGRHRGVLSVHQDAEHYVALADLAVLNLGGVQKRDPGTTRAAHHPNVAAGMITVDQQVIIVDRRPVLASPKTSASLRDVPMPAFVAAAVTGHCTQFGITGSDVLCRTSPGGLLRRDYFNREIWKPALAAAQLPADTTFHDLQHTFASTALAEGVPISEVSRWLGHKSITTTVDLYDHLVPEASGRACDALDKAFAQTCLCPQSAPTAP